MAKKDPNNRSRVVIVGGGPAGLGCAETLRQSDFTGEIIVISAEDVVTYDRTLLTKNLLSKNVSKIRDESFLRSGDIEFRLNTRVMSIDTQEKTLLLKEGQKIVIFFHSNLT